MSAHKVNEVRRITEAVGAELCYLPPCGPDLNAIEPSFAQLNAHPRKAKERTLDTFYDRIATILHLVTPNRFTRMGEEIGVRRHRFAAEDRRLRLKRRAARSGDPCRAR
ncbi:transposase [Hypericibacter sp.]|uniref:transposase n=1 Tax=Hypericibacter sp. TaxID=2705401 RepID=UPI003D6C9513